MISSQRRHTQFLCQRTCDCGWVESIQCPEIALGSWFLARCQLVEVKPISNIQRRTRMTRVPDCISLDRSTRLGPLASERLEHTTTDSFTSAMRTHVFCVANGHARHLQRGGLPPHASRSSRMSSFLFAPVGLAMVMQVLSTASATEPVLTTGGGASHPAPVRVLQRSTAYGNASGSLPTSVVVTMRVRACALHHLSASLHHSFFVGSLT